MGSQLPFCEKPKPRGEAKCYELVPFGTSMGNLVADIRSAVLNVSASWISAQSSLLMTPSWIELHNCDFYITKTT